MCQAYLRQFDKVYISFGPRLLHSSSSSRGENHLREAVGHVPLDRILVESGSPGGKPVASCGIANYEMNHPGLVRRVVEQIAHIKGLSSKTVAQRTGENAAAVFGLDLVRDVMIIGKSYLKNFKKRGGQKK